MEQRKESINGLVLVWVFILERRHTLHHDIFCLKRFPTKVSCVGNLLSQNMSWWHTEWIFILPLSKGRNSSSNIMRSSKIGAIKRVWRSSWCRLCSNDTWENTLERRDTHATSEGNLSSQNMSWWHTEWMFISNLSKGRSSSWNIVRSLLMDRSKFEYAY